MTDLAPMLEPPVPLRVWRSVVVDTILAPPAGLCTPSQNPGSLTSGAPIDKEEADYLAAAQPKRVLTSITWGIRTGGFRDLLVELECPDGTPLRVRGWRNPTGTGFGFSLLYKGTVVIRRWDKRPGHLDPVQKTRSKGGHKHFADPEYGDSRAYGTTDVSLTDANQALTDFLVEVGVERGTIRIQKEIGDY
jgi:hypothetical protein